MITINAPLDVVRWQRVGGRVLVPVQESATVDLRELAIGDEFIVQGLSKLSDKDSVARRLLVLIDHVDAAFTYADVVEVLQEVP